MANRHPGLKVLTSSDYGDHYHTEQAIPISLMDCTEVVRLCKSRYSSSGYEVVHHDDKYGRYQECEEDEQYVLLKQKNW